MVHGFELEIHRLLKETDNPVLVADELLKRWERGELSWKDQESAADFLVHAGFAGALFQQVTKALKLRQKIPWASFVDALGRVHARLTKDEVDQLLVGAAEEEALEDISRSRALDSLDPRFSKIRNSAREERTKKRKQRPGAQVRSGTVVSDKTRPLVENMVKPKKTSFADWARRAEEEAAPDLDEHIEELSVAMIEACRSQPENAYDIAISLRFMGLTQEALRALRFAPKKQGTLWLELDLLLETGRFVQVLQLADSLERKYSGDPEASYSSGYARAIALHGLGQKDEAIVLLESIVKIRPNYRSAHSLLLKWKTEER